MRRRLIVALVAMIATTGIASPASADQQLSCEALTIAIRQTADLLAQHRVLLMNHGPATAARRQDSTQRLLDVHHRLILLHVERDCGRLPIGRRF